MRNGCTRGCTLTRWYACVLVCLITPDQWPRLQFLCPVCSKHKAVKHKHGTMCVDCHNEQQRPPVSPAAATSASVAPASPLSVFGRPEGCIDQLPFVERAAIVTLDKVGWLHKDIAQ